MATYMEQVKKFVSHNQGLVASIVVCAMLLAWSGCYVKTTSPFSGEKVTHSELEAEVQMYIVKVKAAYEDIAQQELIRKAILEAGWAVAQGGGVDFLGLGTTLMGIVGLGAVVDNSRKNTVIKTRTNDLAKLTAKFNEGTGNATG